MSLNNKDHEFTLRQVLIEQLVREGIIRTPRVEDAFRSVPRHLFLPNIPLDKVYSDKAIGTKTLNGQWISSSSQPSVMAIMLEYLQLEPGHKVLEVGTGTGYNAALMSHLVGEKGEVVTIDLDEDIVKSAEECLVKGHFDNVKVLCADGGFGSSDAALYDRIILTVKAGDIAPAWYQQLKLDGRLVLPLSIVRGVPKLVAFEHAKNHLVSVAISDCDFIALRGTFAEPEKTLQLGPEPSLSLWVDDPSIIDKEIIYQWLIGPSKDQSTPLKGTFREIWGKLRLWLALREPAFCNLGPWEVASEHKLVPELFGCQYTFGLLDQKSLCLLTCPADKSENILPSPLSLRSFGPDEKLARRLIEQMNAWDAAGRPGNEALRIRIYPRNSDYVPSENEWHFSKVWSQFILEWVF